jgi:hypothetical protein
MQFWKRKQYSSNTTTSSWQTCSSLTLDSNQSVFSGFSAAFEVDEILSDITTEPTQSTLTRYCLGVDDWDTCPPNSPLSRHSDFRTTFNWSFGSQEDIPALPLLPIAKVSRFEQLLKWIKSRVRKQKRRVFPKTSQAQ